MKRTTLRNESCFKKLAESLLEYADGGELVEIVNTGNWGDALILAGQAKFFDDIGIRIKRISVKQLCKPPKLNDRLRSILSPKKAIFTGSGALYPFYDRPKELELAASRFRHTFIMPSSLTLALRIPTGNLTLWRRDETDSKLVAPDAPFCHDMAFYLEPKPRLISKSVGYLFREDREKTDIPIPKNNRDVSNEGTHISDAEEFFDIVGTYRVIYTNRLHVAIAAALLGREVHMFPNKTGKLQAVYESSLRPFFPKVKFHSSKEEYGELLGTDYDAW
ncbi:polysaccharide pyruvyl transferase family protein [Loktanella agnita]|uniref:polysaccharide pyruvyl transferase family protein n=1 Tax=Loktanella agnita TaxID=287097 RepID=UPI00398880A6